MYLPLSPHGVTKQPPLYHLFGYLMWRPHWIKSQMSGFKLQLCHLSAVYVWVNHLMLLKPNFLNCQIGLVSALWLTGWSLDQMADCADLALEIIKCSVGAKKYLYPSCTYMFVCEQTYMIVSCEHTWSLQVDSMILERGGYKLCICAVPNTGSHAYWHLMGKWKNEIPVVWEKDKDLAISYT